MCAVQDNDIAIGPGGSAHVEFELLESGYVTKYGRGAVSSCVEGPPRHGIATRGVAIGANPCDLLLFGRLQDFQLNIFELHGRGRAAVELQGEDALQFLASWIVVFNFGCEAVIDSQGDLRADA